VSVRVVFGSWCPHCKMHVPQLLAVERALRGSGIAFSYHGIAQDWKDPEVQKLGVKALPTVVVSRGGKEVGRLVGTSWEAPESFLRKLLAPAPGSK
jgi:thiol-disulfide isomerase/thioredoxin